MQPDFLQVMGQSSCLWGCLVCCTHLGDLSVLELNFTAQSLEIFLSHSSPAEFLDGKFKRE